MSDSILQRLARIRDDKSVICSAFGVEPNSVGPLHDCTTVPWVQGTVELGGKLIHKIWLLGPEGVLYKDGVPNVKNLDTDDALKAERTEIIGKARRSQGCTAFQLDLHDGNGEECLVLAVFRDDLQVTNSTLVAFCEENLTPKNFG